MTPLLSAGLLGPPHSCDTWGDAFHLFIQQTPRAAVSGMGAQACWDRWDTHHNHVVSPSLQDEALARSSVSRVVPRSVFTCGPTHVARLEFPRETGLILRCAGKAGNPFQTTQGKRLSCRDQEGTGPPSSCVWNPRVFADDARGWQCPFVWEQET